MAGALEDCLVVAGGLEAVEPKRKVFINDPQNLRLIFKFVLDICEDRRKTRCRGHAGLLLVEGEAKEQGEPQQIFPNHATLEYFVMKALRWLNIEYGHSLQHCHNESFEVVGDTCDATSCCFGWSCCCPGRGLLKKISMLYH